MGCDIHSVAEILKGGKWQMVGAVFPHDSIEKEIYKTNATHEPFRWRHYGFFAWLAGVRNYSGIKPLSRPRCLPTNMSQEAQREYEGWEDDAHSASWFLLPELLGVDYDQIIEDRRRRAQPSPIFQGGAETCEPGKGIQRALREFLPNEFFESMDILKRLGDPDKIRVIFWFDN